MHEHEAVQQGEQATEEFDSLEGYDAVQEQGPSEPIADVGLGFSEAGFDVGIDVNVVDHERAFEEAAVCEVVTLVPIGIEMTIGIFRSDGCDDGFTVVNPVVNPRIHNQPTTDDEAGVEGDTGLEGVRARLDRAIADFNDAVCFVIKAESLRDLRAYRAAILAAG